MELRVPAAAAGTQSRLQEGAGTTAQFNYPSSVTVDSSGNLYVADTRNHRIRKITPAGKVTTFAGSTQGYNTEIATGEAAQFNLSLIHI